MRLKNLTFLITRPIHQTKNLSALLQMQGGSCVLLPTLTITPLPNNLTAITQLPTSIDKIIFTSANAVYPVMPYWHKINAAMILAIGPGTANALADFSITAQQPANQQFNSEGLLALPTLTNVTKQHIIIFSGEGGRTILQETLRQRGAYVDKISVYRRQPVTTPQSLPALENINLIVSTSYENLVALTQLYEKFTVMLYQRPLLVISIEMAALAKKLGFANDIIVTNNSSDAAIVDAALTWHSNKQFDQYPTA